MAKRELPPWQSAPLAVLVLTLGLFASALPRGLELALGRRLGRMVFRLRLFKRRTIEANLRRCFPEMGDVERAKLIKANYEHYGILLFEFMHFFSPFPGHWRGYVQRTTRLVGRENWEKAHSRGKGVLFYSAHMASWEVTAAAAAVSGIAATIVTTVLTPRWLHDKITASRASVNMLAAFHPGSMVSVLKTLRRGGSVAFMNDQYARPPMGIPVNFFNTLVDTLSVVGPLAKRTGAAVVSIHGVRGVDGVTTTTIGPELDFGDAAGDPHATTQLIAADVEKWVRRDPSQWLWMHRRFKNIQGEA